MSQAAQVQYPVVEWLVGKIADATVRLRRQRAAFSELASLGPDEVAAVARDLGVTPEQLRDYASQGHEFPKYLELMLGALKFDRARSEAADPILLSDMKVLCSICRNKRRCKRELLAGTAADNFSEFCPNAGSLDILSRYFERSPAPFCH